MNAEQRLHEEMVAANVAFDDACQRRHEMGAEKYGEGTFLDKDTIQMTMDELVDMSNYLRYTYIKLYLMRKDLEVHFNGTATPLPGKSLLGKDAIFNPYGTVEG